MSTSFRIFLAERFEAARRRNPRYSLRAFARQIKIDHATLSQVLRGRRPLTPKSIRRIGSQLGLSEQLISFYAKRPGSTKDAVRAEPLQLSLDAFHVISDWYHHAVLELIHTKDFRPDSRWIAKSLGLTVNEVNIALQRLLRLGLLQMSGPKWLDKSARANIPAEELTPALHKRIRAQGHRLALEALDTAPHEQIEHEAMTLAIRSADLPRIRELVREFFGDLESILSEPHEKDDVYEFQFAAFPLTAYKRKEKHNG